MKANKISQVIPTLFILAATSVGWAAETPLRLGSETTYVKGHVRDSAKVYSLAYYVPSYKFDKSLSTKGCDFAEDAYDINKTDKFVRIESTRANGAYSLEVPTKGRRGSCDYSLQSVYMTIDNGTVYEPITLKTKSAIDKANQELIDAELPPAETTAFTELQEISCDFDNADKVGYCVSKDESLIEPEYQISNEAQVYTLEIKDQAEASSADASDSAY